MIQTRVIKEIIVSNEEFILKEASPYNISRGNVYLPESLNKVVIFYGIRRSGKTFILYDLFRKSPDNSIYIDFEDDRLEGFELADFQRLKECFYELKPSATNACFYLDEVQTVDGWERFCRRAVEREGIKIYVSGSSSKIMPAEMQTELRGRAWHISIMPFSFREYLTLHHIDSTDRATLYGKGRQDVKRHFNRYALWGGFPEVCLSESDFQKRKILREYLDAMFFKDVVERYRISNIALLERLFDKVLSSFATKMSLTSFYKHYKDTIPMSKDTLFNYYSYLHQSMLIHEIKIFAESTYKRLRNPVKIYTTDIGLCKKVTSQDRGRILENLVCIELHRRGYECFYFSGRHECDFIAKDNEGKLIVIQVCADVNEDNKTREIMGLLEACRFVNIKEGLILTDDDEMEISQEGLNISFIPVWKWLCT